MSKSKSDEASIFNAEINTLDPAQPECIELGTSLDDAIRRIQEHRFGCILITDKGRLAGILSERDLTLDVLGKGVDLSEPVDGFMTPDPEVLKPDDPIAYALNRMSLGGYRHVPLVDAEGRPVGIVSVKDVVDYLVEHFPGHVYNLPPEPDVFPKSREGG